MPAVHALHQAVQLSAWPDGFTPPLAVLHVAALPLAVKRPRLAMGVVAALGLVQCALAFPRTATHLYLGVVVSLLLCLLDDDDPLLKRLALALPLVVFCWSGVQKLVHGYWVRGQLLAWVMVSRSDVAWVARPLLDDATAARLGTLARDVEGSGPFRLGGAWLVLSNGVWLVELLAPLLLFARAHAWWLLLGLTFGIQLFAHEWQFGLLLANLLLLAAPPVVAPRGRALVAVSLGVLLVARLAGVSAPEVL